jgi:protein-L-isoaspartate(D-aspartate) O-methyltransferase
MSDPARLMRFILELRQAGVTDARVLAAMERTPREDYAPPHLRDLAHDDINLPLAQGQSLTRPSVVGRMAAALDAQPSDHVLEIGTGSGYQAAVLAQLAHTVFTIDSRRDLIADARARFGVARLMRVFAHVGDGAEGWPDDAPYDRIIVNAAMEAPAPALLAQLKPGGALVAPIGDADGQRIIRFRNDERVDFGPVKFAPLEAGPEP